MFFSLSVPWFWFLAICWYEQSTLVQGSVPAALQLKFRGRLSEGSIYTLSGFDVTRRNPRFKLSDGPVSIRFNQVTEQLSIILLHNYHFRSSPSDHILVLWFYQHDFEFGFWTKYLHQSRDSLCKLIISNFFSFDSVCFKVSQFTDYAWSWFSLLSIDKLYSHLECNLIFVTLGTKLSRWPLQR